ncbi:MAG TPA: 23S rRNA (pseudouridine(1915)-N(3))-methyltransferase RlmH [Burkholderiales bacterium]|nr:23S rRNA (pseudouridine(1915)-N(3))-methyltransferase RlmH [Burkholderiales bacterium]
MARLHVVAFAARLPAWALEARSAWLARMPKGFEVDCLDLKSGSLARVRARLPGGTRIVALDERGKDLSTREFARLVLEPTAFLIGGPDGLDPQLRAAAALTLRLSALTLPHVLAQLVLVEQLYRAASIHSGHPYHRE